MSNIARIEENYPIANVKVPERKRKVDKSKAEALSASIKALGQLQPIGITEDGTLLWGAHRLKACELAARTTIRAAIYSVSNPLDAELAEIDENLIRNELTELEQATQLARRKAIYLERYPSTGHGGDRKSAKAQSSRQDDALKAPTFAQNAATATGLSERTVQRKTAVGEALSPLAADLKDTPIADNQSELLALSKLKPDAQRGVVGLLKAGEVESVKEALKLREAQERQKAKALRAEASPVLTQTGERVKVERGFWYRLGDHYLYCGDSSQAAFWRHIPPCAFGFADPPYNVNIDAWDNEFVWNHDYLTDVASVVAVTAGNNNIQTFMRLTEMQYRWAFSVSLTNNMAVSPVGYHNWDFVALFADPKVSIHRGVQDEIRVAISNSDTADSDHRGRKNLDAMIRLVQIYTEKGDRVIDPFAGSGTTLFACEGLGRICYTAELEVAHCEEIIDRFIRETGKPVTRYDNFV